ncbi:MAG: LysR family transcriptional regulator [Burkholderiales bacterium]
MDRLQAMTTFVAVVDSGGFASAARKLSLSPPVVTRAVGELEARLGLRLLTRTTRFVRVTEAGARYADDCRRILAEIDEAETAATGAHATPRGTLTITAPVLFGHLYVTPILVIYLQRYKDVDAKCEFLDRVVNIVAEGIDIAVRIGELPDSSLQATHVGRVRRVVVASPAYLKAHGVPRRPDELVEHTIIAASGVTPNPEWRFIDGGKPVIQRLHARMRTTTNDSAISATVAGLGITRLLNYQVAAQIRGGQLKIMLEDFETVPLPVHVVHHEGRRATQKVRGFIELAIETLRADPALE